MDLDAVLGVPELVGTRWGVEVLDADMRVLAGAHETSLLPTASLAKVFVLAEVADQLSRGFLDDAEPLDRVGVEPVADSGLWQHLGADRLSVADAAVLVGSVSDNLATNVLIDRVGLAAVQRRAAALAPHGSMLHDVVRDVRRPEHPRWLSEGCARDYARWFATAGGDSRAGRLVKQWLSTGADLSMVASAFDLDPLAHAGLSHKTGTDAGVRADAGTISWRGRTASYAAICAWDDDTDPDRLTAVLKAMRAIGAQLRTLLEE